MRNRIHLSTASPGAKPIGSGNLKNRKSFSDQQEIKKRKISLRNSPSASSSSSLRELEENLVKELLSSSSSSKQDERQSKEKKEKEEEKSQLWKEKKFKLSRAVAAPVEEILFMSQNDDPAILPDFYAVLRVTPKAAEQEIKRSFRQLSVLIHPDKNPHPEAGLAFDALNSAFTVLSSSNSRQEYDRERIEQTKSFSRRGRWTIQKLRRRYNENIFNMKARLLLWKHQWRTNDQEGLFEEVTAARQYFADCFHSAKDLCLHFSLLPSLYDRILLMNELLLTRRRRGGRRPVLWTAVSFSVLLSIRSFLRTE
jgi:hypothetical protein